MCKFEKSFKYLCFIAINLLLIVNYVYAQADNCEWGKTDKSKLNVLEDLEQVSGRIWYVDGKKGNDNNSGMTLETAWETIGKAFDHYKGRPAPGDTVVITSGIYKEKIWIRSRGKEDKPIFVGPYGDGEVIIDASQKIGEWTLYDKKIYKTFCESRPIAVVVNDIPLFPEFSLKKINKGKWYYDEKLKLLYVFLFDGDNPKFYEVGVIKNNKDERGIFLNWAENIVLYGLTVKYAGGHGISILGNHNRIEKCNLKFNGTSGIYIWSYGKMPGINNEVLNSHIYHNMIRNWPRGRYKTGGWAPGVAATTPNNSFIGNIVHKNGGEGLLAYSGGKNTVFRNNIVYDNWSVNIYMDGVSDCLVERNFVFCNESNIGDLYNNGDKSPKDGKNKRRLRAEGIMTADENKPAKLENIKIINNIIIGCRRGITHYAATKGSGLKNVLIANNTIIVPDEKGVREDYVGLRVPYNNGNNKDVILRNNIIYATHPSTYLLSISTDPLKRKDDLYGLTFDHNLWYHSNNKKPFHVGPAWIGIFDMDFNKWIKKCKSKGQGDGSKFSNPNFSGGSKYLVNSFKLMLGSPAIDAGGFVQGLDNDYEGNKRKDSKFDIGAFEFITN